MSEINREEGDLNSDEEKYDPYALPKDGQEFKLTPEQEAVAPPEEEKREKTALEKETELAQVRREIYEDKELGIGSESDELVIETNAWDKIEKAKKEMKEADLSHREKLVLDLREKEKKIQQQRINEELATEKLKEKLKKEKIEKFRSKIGEI